VHIRERRIARADELLVRRDTTGFWELLGMIAGWLAGLGATILLWQRSSSRYFGAAPRY